MFLVDAILSLVVVWDETVDGEERVLCGRLVFRCISRSFVYGLWSYPPNLRVCIGFAPTVTSILLRRES